MNISDDHLLDISLSHYGSGQPTFNKIGEYCTEGTRVTGASFEESYKQDMEFTEKKAMCAAGDRAGEVRVWKTMWLRQCHHNLKMLNKKL